jgi:hypothetical protein
MSAPTNGSIPPSRRTGSLADHKVYFGCCWTTASKPSLVGILCRIKSLSRAPYNGRSLILVYHQNRSYLPNLDIYVYAFEGATRGDSTGIKCNTMAKQLPTNLQDHIALHHTALGNVSNVTMSMSNALDSSSLLCSAVQSKKEKT